MKEQKKARGGKRPGAGMPKGFKTQKTIAKEEARAALRQIVLSRMRELVESQMSNAVGIKFLVVRQKSTGKFKRRVGATDPNTHDPDTEIIEVWEKDPSTPAFTDLMNRAIDKPAEQTQEVEHTGEIAFRWASK